MLRNVAIDASRGIRHWALGIAACAVTPGVTAGAPQRMARLPSLPNCRIFKLSN